MGSERMFGTLQDRLPKELKLAGVTTIDAANRYDRGAMGCRTTVGHTLHADAPR
ncbi:hypothetical protein [Mesorhizobium sp.]|uniref:hypothetical protein n=1 Tax=Mesorhizobium sp. TaxID=1871066 RepID=UPI00257A779D|nr:hypothetical protein [Mesorhizobium sp.]